MINENAIALFDMDGTLTLPREKIEKHVITALKGLSKHARIGIITGSDLDYIYEQCGLLFEIGGVDVDKVDLLPCNGTKLLRWQGSSFKSLHNADMIDNIGRKNYRDIISKIFHWQAEIAMLYPDLPFTGTFVQYRGSLLNWCPIGRSADLEQRAEWKGWDKDFSIRENYMDEIAKYITEKNMNVTVALGGSTSFDIYPDGWNKTYGLKHYKDKSTFFVGDRCKPGGNDWHLYEELKTKNAAWETTGPDNTVKLIKGIIDKIS